MVFLSADEIKSILEINNEQYIKLIKPVEMFFIDIEKAIEDIDQETIIKLNSVNFHLNNKIAYYVKTHDMIKREMMNIQYNLISLITKNSEIVINNANKDAVKLCFDKKKIGKEGYENHEFLDISKTEITKFATQLILNKYNLYMDKECFKDPYGDIYKTEELAYRIKILSNMTEYLKNLNYNIK